MIETEYEAARRGAAVTALDERGVLVATGPKRQSFLHGLLSNDVASLASGEGRLAALMDVRGHLTALLRVLATPDAVWLEMPADRIAVVEATLEHYRVGAPVRFKPAATRITALVGPGTNAVLGGVGAEVPPARPEAHVETAVAGVAVRIARASDLPGEGVTIYSPEADAERVRAALVAAGALAFGSETLDVLRIEAGRPWYGPDVGDANLLHETGLLREYHSATKGCYLGQEVVARLEGRGGHVNKHLRGLKLAAPARRGATVAVGGENAGQVTTAGVSPAFGPIAMAYVHRAHAVPGTAATVDGAPAEIVSLPFVHLFQRGGLDHSSTDPDSERGKS